MTSVVPPPVRQDTAPPNELVFTYALEEPVSVGQPNQVHLERWVVSVMIGDPESPGGRVTIGDAKVLIINLEGGRDVRDFADTASGEWREKVRTAAEAPLAATQQPEEVQGPSHLLVLERVWVDATHRGHGLGPIIAARVIDRLGRGCHLAACYPAPFDGACRPEDREREIEALGRIWAKVGFRPWRDGVWMLDLEERRTRQPPLLTPR